MRHMMTRYPAVLLLSAITLSGWGVLITPQPVAAQTDARSLCRITQTTAARYQANAVNSAPLNPVPTGTPVILANLPTGGNPLVEVVAPANYAGFVPVAALTLCPSALTSGAETPSPNPSPVPNQCRKVVGQVFPNLTTVNLRSDPSNTSDANLIGTVARGATVYVVLNGNTVKSFNDGYYVWVQLDLAKTQAANTAGQFNLTKTAPAAVWMFNSQKDRPGLNNLGTCPAR
jgi:hypothetical protein